MANISKINMSQNNHLKARVYSFYNKEQVINDPNNREILGLGDIVKDVNYICALCYDTSNIMIDAHKSYNNSMTYGRHNNCKDIAYCSKIQREVLSSDSEYIKNMNIHTLINTIKHTIFQ